MSIQFSFYAVEALNNQVLPYVSHRFTVSAECDDKAVALFSFIYKRTELHNHVLIDDETLCPITFDTTVFLKGGSFEKTGKPIPVDVFNCTMAGFLEKMDRFERTPDLHHFSSKPCFCRFIKSKSGKAGEFFNFHVPAIIKKSNYAEGSIFNDDTKVVNYDC